MPYMHYSVLMSKSTKQALYSAANVDLTKMKSAPGKRGRNWFIDRRVGKENQIPNYPYEGTMWDRGHLTSPDFSQLFEIRDDGDRYEPDRA